MVVGLRLEKEVAGLFSLSCRSVSLVSGMDPPGTVGGGNVSVSSGVCFNDEPGPRSQMNNCEIYSQMEQKCLEPRALGWTRGLRSWSFSEPVNQSFRQTPSASGQLVLGLQSNPVGPDSPSRQPLEITWNLTHT